jgi:hypothetical protein
MTLCKPVLIAELVKAGSLLQACTQRNLAPYQNGPTILKHVRFLNFLKTRSDGYESPGGSQGSRGALHELRHFFPSSVSPKQLCWWLSQLRVKLKPTSKLEVKLVDFEPVMH